MCLLAASCLLVSRPLSPQISPVVLRMSAPVAQMSPELDVLTKLSNEELKERVTAMAGASPAFAAWLEAQEWPVPAAAVAAPVAPKANGMVTPWADIVPGTDAQRLSDASAAKTVLTLCKGGTLCTPFQLNAHGSACISLRADGGDAIAVPDKTVTRVINGEIVTKCHMD